MSEDKKQETAISTELSMSQRFTDKVLSEFTSNAGNVNVTEADRSRIQGYFIVIDKLLKTTELDRIRKNENNSDPKYNNELPYSWTNVDLEYLARDVMINTKMGLDMTLPNQVSAIPYKNTKTNKYVFTFIKGYEGKKLLVDKYALDQPKNIVIELVKTNDFFLPIKKSHKQPIESYEFKIENPFDRGEIIGGFGYIKYEDSTKNRLIIMSLADILKRKPEKASAEFWGGEKAIYKNGKKTTETTKIEGWFEEMCFKTVSNHVYGKIPLDFSKIYEYNQHLLSRESDLAELEASSEIAEKANRETLEFEDGEFADIPSEASKSSLPDEEKTPDGLVEEETPKKPDWA